MKTGDTIKIIEKVRQKFRVTIGEITSIDQYKINIIKIRNNRKTFYTSFNIADCRGKDKQFYILRDREWVKINIKITQPLVV